MKRLKLVGIIGCLMTLFCAYRMFDKVLSGETSAVTLVPPVMVGLLGLVVFLANWSEE